MVNKILFHSIAEELVSATNSVPLKQAPALVDLAYCAGVIDSDGTIGIRKRLIREPGKKPYYNFMEMIIVGQVEIEAVALLKNLFDGSIMVRKGKNKNSKDLYI